MKKKQFLMIFVALLMAYTANAQTCSILTNITPNGTININGIKLGTLSFGSVENKAGYLEVGKTGPWQVYLIFDTAINDLNISISDAGQLNQTQEFNFSSDIGVGDITISSTNAQNSIINKSKIVAGGTGLGQGIFKIHGDKPYKALVVQGEGGFNGALMGICSSGFLGIDNIDGQSKNAIVFPNPVKDKVTITSKENIKAYQIFDESGKLVISVSSLKGNQHILDVSHLKKGVYIISMETENQKINKKFIKE